jgi:uncharacterized protein YebE (UPF0316 family)
MPENYDKLMTEVDLSNLHCFDNDLIISRLNRFIDINESLMPHSIAIATGCKLEEALTLLFTLYDKYLVEGYLLLYHKAHLDFPFEIRNLSEGIPQKSISCSICETTDIPREEIFYDFEFKLRDQVIFIT